MQPTVLNPQQLPAEIRGVADTAAQADWRRAHDRLRGAGYGSAVPRAFERASTRIAEVAGVAPAIALGGVVSFVAIKSGPRVAESLCRVAAAVSVRWPNAATLIEWLAMVGNLARKAPAAVSPFLESMDVLGSRLSLPALDAWVLAGLRLAGRDQDKLLAYFNLASPDATRMLEREAGTVTFFDVERRLRAYVSALFDLSPPIRVAPPGPDGTARRTSFAGGVIQTPATFPGFKGRETMVFRASLAHIGAHLRYAPGRFPVGQLKPLQLAVVSLVEDARVEQLAMRDMPGLRRLWQPFHVAQPGGITTASSLFARLARALIDPSFEDPDGWVRKGRAMFFEAKDRWADQGVSRHIGNLLGNDLGQLRVQFNAKTYVVEPAYRDDNLGLWDFGDAPSEQAESLDVMVDTVKLRRSEPDPSPSDRQSEAQGEDRPGQRMQSVAPVIEDRDTGRPLASYPEYDFAIGRERPNWTTVKGYPPAPGNPRFWEELRERRGPLMAKIATLVRSAEVGQTRRLKRQAEGETLDIDAGIDAAIALRTARAPDHRIYEGRSPPQRDLAVHVLLDISQSTGDLVPETGRSILDIERDAAAILAHAMNEFGDPYAITAFSSAGREDVRVTEIKRFSDPLDAAVGSALAGLRPEYSTRMGAALRHAGAALAQVPRHRRLVLLITDGEPSDIDCPDPDYLVQDARRAVQSLSSMGIDVFCVGLGPRNKEQEAAIFGRNGFIQIDRVRALPDKLPLLYLRLTR